MQPLLQESRSQQHLKQGLDFEMYTISWTKCGGQNVNYDFQDRGLGHSANAFKSLNLKIKDFRFSLFYTASIITICITQSILDVKRSFFSFYQVYDVLIRLFCLSVSLT